MIKNFINWVSTFTEKNQCSDEENFKDTKLMVLFDVFVMREQNI
jgi:hypothetical protein